MLGDGERQHLIASPEKALCDLMTVTSGLVFRSTRELAAWLEQDLRMDTDALRHFDIRLLKQLAEAATFFTQPPRRLRRSAL